MTAKNRWLFIVLTGCLLGGSVWGPMGNLQAAPAAEKVAEVYSVSVNKGTADELESVRGIGPLLAKRIIEYRATNGRFEKLEDLIRVPGIGQAKFEKIRSQITL